MNRLAQLLCLTPILLAACAATTTDDRSAPASPVETPAPGAGRPNIVVLFADDAGFSDFGFQPDSMEDMRGLTPHIDSIADEGAVFRAFYMSACVCSPSRAGLMTGRYQQRFGHEKNIPPGYMKGGMALAEATIADRLAEAGYETALVGKWHLGYPDPYHPNERGFDWFMGCLQGSRPYLEMEEPTPHRVLLRDRSPTPEDGYVTDRFGDAAVEFIEKEREEPFFLFVSFTAPHGPLQPRPGDVELPELASIEKTRRRNYAGLVKAMDDNVGKIMEALERTGISEDTLVLFTNDNGGQTQTAAVNKPLRGRKGQLYEGGIRVPAALRWPGVVAPGTVIETPAISLDLTPTFLAAAGSTPRPGAELDGLDLTAVLRGEGGGPLTERSLYWRRSGGAGPIAARRGRWKLLLNDRSKDAELFDLVADVSERRDVAADHPAVVAELMAELRAYEAELIEPLWP
ncbi:MAG: sulfatase-like hydrolase/transferase [Planctomycetota bacterium]|nr:sulfatase-like hydrolase/transferase [Planctomycetota bacterium]